MLISFRSGILSLLKATQKKGLLGRGLKRGVEKKQWTQRIQPPKNLKNFRHYVRLHGLEFRIRILMGSHFYDQQIKKDNLIPLLDGHKVRLHKESIRIWAIDKDFSAEDEIRASALAMQYYHRLFMRLEHELKVELLKPRKHNIKVVNHHYSEVDNELSKEYHKKNLKLNVYCEDSGRLWFKIDNSFQLHEAETVHPDTAEEDMSKVKHHFNDIRSKPHYDLSEISQFMVDTQKQINDLAHGLKTVVSVLQVLLPGQEEQEQDRPEYLG